MLSPIDITAEIKHMLNIASATFHDCPKPTIISIMPMMEKLRIALILLLIEPYREKFLLDVQAIPKQVLKTTPQIYIL